MNDVTNDSQRPGALYWSVIDPYWEKVSIYGSPRTFLRQFRKLPTSVGHLFAAHWNCSEVLNGGIHQFFYNPTGILAPEAVAGLRAIGLEQLALIVTRAMDLFPTPYPRAFDTRRDLLDAHDVDEDPYWEPFESLTNAYYGILRVDPDLFDRSADEYARRTSAN